MAEVFDFNQYARGGFKTVVVASILIVMLCLMVGGRLLSRTLQRAKIAADDYVLFVATVYMLRLLEMSRMLTCHRY